MTSSLKCIDQSSTTPFGLSDNNFLNVIFDIIYEYDFVPCKARLNKVFLEPDYVYKEDI